MLPYSTLIQLHPDRDTPLYLQVSNRLIQLMTEGTLAPGMRLPSSRKLSEVLNIHRKTVIAAYDELIVQGWAETKTGSGTYVNKDLPIVQASKLLDNASAPLAPEFTPEYSLRFGFNDGHPDVRLAPLKSLVKEYNSLVNSKMFLRQLNYQFQFMGDPYLRQQLSSYLHETRGIVASPNEILLTRGSIMAFYLIMAKYIEPGDNVVVGDPSYQTFNDIIAIHKGNKISIPVDQYGMDTDVLEKVCQKQKISMVYVISHHHHPTTVKLIPERRLKLLQLAEKYNFRILEDDYDYDFHYEGSSVLPLASTNRRDRIIYAGSFSKTLVPSLRLGFLVIKEEWAEELSQLRRYIDRTGDPMLERAMGVLLESGEVKRTLNKANVAYKSRRDFLCDLLDRELKDEVEFEVPGGGMAIWVTFKEHIDVQKLIAYCEKRDLHISNPKTYQSRQSTRLGYASMNEEEIKNAFEILKDGIRQVQLPS